jgi:hypothetical protein
MSVVILVALAIVLIVLLTPIVRSPNESFMNEIDVPPCGLIMGGQGEELEAHRTDVHSRISRVRLTDPTSRWSQSYL